MTDKEVIIDNNTDRTEIAATNCTKASATSTTAATAQSPKDSFEGRKHQPDIDGPMQDSQETDEIYVDPRKQEDLPAGGVNVGDLNAADLSKEANK